MNNSRDELSIWVYDQAVYGWCVTASRGRTNDGSSVLSAAAEDQQQPVVWRYSRLGVS